MAREHFQHSNKLSSCCCSSITLLLLLCPLLALSYTTVKYLPGFEGPLPFELETGYIEVGKSGDVELFYYFVKSESNPEVDPLMLWLTGGPGCSGFSGLVYEIGPLTFKDQEYNGSLPTLVLNPYSWTKICISLFSLYIYTVKCILFCNDDDDSDGIFHAASIIFIDSPVGTGFSYSKSIEGSKRGDIESCDQAYQFLRKWLVSHPEFLSHSVYIGGDSYSGKTIPLLVQNIAFGIEAGSEPSINLKGYLIGNPVTDHSRDSNKVLPYAHRMGLISDEIYESAKRTCRGEYINVDPSNGECLKNLQVYDKCISRINTLHILEPVCDVASPKPQEKVQYRRSIAENFNPLINQKQTSLLDPRPPYPAANCRSHVYLLSYYWADDKRVRKVLQIREGSVPEWQRCSYDLPYDYEIESSYEYHVNLSARGYRSLIYSGDHDMSVPYLGTQAWIRALNYSIVDDGRQWLVGGQVGGLTWTYSNKMTFATVKGGGHTAPEYCPRECFVMFSKWISEEPL